MDERIDNSARETGVRSPVRDYEELGEHVASVLNAAEQAAEQIRSDAQRTAEQTRRDAEADAHSYAEERRREVDAESERRRADAVADASAIRDTARDAARRVADEGRRRLGELRDDASALERRFESAIDELRDLVSQLDDVVLSRGRGEPAAAPVDPSAPTLDEALRPRGGGEAEGRVEADAEERSPAPDAGRSPLP